VPAKTELSGLSKVRSSNVQILWKKPIQNGSSGTSLKFFILQGNAHSIKSL